MRAIVAIIFIVALALALAITASAAPFLVCDVPPTDWGVTAVRGEIDGTAFTTPYTVASGALLVYDIGGLSAARHSFTNIRFVNARGEGQSVPFVLPALPGSPSNIHLTP